MRTVCLTITTRGNYAKLKSVAHAMQQYPDLLMQVVVGGGAILDKYGSIIDSLQDMPMIDRRIHFLVAGENPVAMAKSAGLAITEFSTAFHELQPDLVMVVGDRFETLPIAMAASYLNIPVAHLEGGEVSGSIDESIRHAITKLAHLHFPATASAAERIVRLGEEPVRVFPVGGTSLDVLAALDLDNIEPVIGLQERTGVGPVIDLHKPYLVVIQHPVTTEYTHNARHIGETIQAIAGLGMPTIWVWPNMDAGADGVSKGLRIFREREHPQCIHFFKSVPIEYYGPLLKNAACIVGNSSSGIRESGFLGTPAVNIGSRQSSRERSPNVLDVPYEHAAIREAIARHLQHGRFAPDYTYGDGKAGERIARIVHATPLSVQKRITY